MSRRTWELVLWAIGVLGFLLPAAQARPWGLVSPRAPAGTTVRRNLEYARIDKRVLLLDLYLPAKVQRPLPVILWIHGGGWHSGSKDPCPIARFAAHGYAVASINYRLSGTAIFPAQIEDCKAAVRWLRANAARYHLNGDRIGVCGSSSGGHLAALLGTSAEVKELETEGGNLSLSSRVQAVCELSGPVDFLQLKAHGSSVNHDVASSPESRLIGGPIQENKDWVAKANPITHISKDDPPFLIIHGDRDTLVPLKQSQLLQSALEEAGITATLQVVKGAGHGISITAVEKQMLAFFHHTLQEPDSSDTTVNGKTSQP